jgi:hypothetical protein
MHAVTVKGFVPERMQLQKKIDLKNMPVASVLKYVNPVIYSICECSS